MNRHTAPEKGLLFPAFEERSGLNEVGPTATMRLEHAQMRGPFGHMRASLNQPRRAAVRRIWSTAQSGGRFARAS